MLEYYCLKTIAIKDINEISDIPKPKKQQMVLIGCPNEVVYPIPINSQPNITEANNKMTLSL